MLRKTLDAIPVSAGLAIAAVVIVAGVLLTWGHSSITSNVRNAVGSQKITFPASNSQEIAVLPAADATALSKYAGQVITTGPQAETYADHLMPAQLGHIAGGQTYDQVNTKLATAGRDKTMFIKAALLFRGETIQDQLMYANGFWKIGQLMLIGAIVAFAIAAIMLTLSAFGLGRRVVLEAEALLKSASRPAVETA